MPDKEYLLQLLDFDFWANEEFFDQIEELPSEEISKQRESLMNSILNSVNHLLVIDYIWLAHMKGEGHGYTHLQTILHDDIKMLREDKKKSAKAVRDYVENLSDEELEEVVEYELIGGNKGKLSRYMIITHLAMHGSYHRGFIADMFGQVPVMSPGQDIPVWERALREG